MGGFFVVALALFGGEIGQVPSEVILSGHGKGGVSEKGLGSISRKKRLDVVEKGLGLGLIEGFHFSGGGFRGWSTGGEEEKEN